MTNRFVILSEFSNSLPKVRRGMHNKKKIKKNAMLAMKCKESVERFHNTVHFFGIKEKSNLLLIMIPRV